MNKIINLRNRKRSSFLALAVAVVALFATAPAALAQTIVPFNGLNGLGSFSPNDVVCPINPNTGQAECFQVGQPNNITGAGGPTSQGFSERRIQSGSANPTTRISNTGDNVNLCAPVQQIANTGNVANEQGVVQNGTPGFIPITAYATRIDNGFPNGINGNGTFFIPGVGFVDGDGIPIGSNNGFFNPNNGFFNGNNGNGETDLEGSSINVDGSLSSECNQTISQAAAAGPGASAAAGGAVASPGQAAAGGAVATAGGAVAAPPGAAAPGPVAAIVPGGVAGVAARAGGGMLPSTGGPAITTALALGAGVLLIGGGLLAYRRVMQ